MVRKLIVPQAMFGACTNAHALLFNPGYKYKKLCYGVKVQRREQVGLLAIHSVLAWR